MNNKNKLQVIKKGFFSKLKSFIFNLFSKKNIEQTQVECSDNQENIEKFRENLSRDVIKRKDKDTTMALQKGLQLKNLQIQDLSDKQLNDIILLYKLQIKEKKERLKKYRKQINNYTKM